MFWLKKRKHETVFFIVAVLKNDDGTFEVNTDFFIDYRSAINFMKMVKINFKDVLVECILFNGKEIKHV